ncbi:MAG: IS1 family transposase, partial [Anaerolineae bacterium]
MIEETITYSCRSCGSRNIIRNGRNKCGTEQYHCKDCGAYRVIRPHEKYSAESKATILRAYRERMSLRGIQRVFGVWRKTVLRWLEAWVAQLPSLVETLLPAQADDVLELDEMVSFVSEKWFKRWLWTAQCRRTRQIVAYAIGDRSQDTCRLLWQAIPSGYRSFSLFTDHWQAYELVLPPEQ